MTEAQNQRAAVEAIRQEFELSRGSRIWTDYVNALRLVSQVVFTRSSGFVLEFIQNAEDAGRGDQGRGEVTISINRKRMKFVHNGRPFDEANLGAICGIRSSKKPELGTLGYLGIGFKSVFKVADCVEVYSGGYCFKFDRSHPEWLAREADTPWHVIPIWIDRPSESIETEKTSFVIYLRDEDAYSHIIEGLKAIRAELYLFLKWIKHISIRDESSSEIWIVEDSGSTAEGISTLKQNGKEHRFKFFRREIAVPESIKSDRLTQEYRANVTKREIAIAFAIDATGNLDPSPSTAMYGGVYSFLPLGESKSGAKFPIQADFLVQPGRDSINAEALWNHWLLSEVALLAKEAIEFFQRHDIWRYQYLAAFEFKRSPGFETYDKLFGPRLIDPIDQLLTQSPSVLTANDTWAKPAEVVLVSESPGAIATLSNNGIIAAEAIAPILGGEPNLKAVHPRVAAALPGRFKVVSRETLFENDAYLIAMAQTQNGPSWFRSLYHWLNDFPVYSRSSYGRPKVQLRRYHDKAIVLRADNTISTGGSTFVLDLGTADTYLTKLAYELQPTKPMVHPEILSGAADDCDREKLRGFLTGYAGVQKMDAKVVCLEAVLPKITTASCAPAPDELLNMTKYCKVHLSSSFSGGHELWVLDKRNLVRKASDVILSSEFKPLVDWERYKQFVPGASFLSSEYLANTSSPPEVHSWRDFLLAGCVKQAPANGVEVFAIKYTEDKLSTRFRNIVPVERLNHGYDLEAEDLDGQKLYIEVKGLTAEGNVDLTANEAKAASIYRNRFLLCVVVGIPGAPMLYLLRDPHEVGQKDKLTIRIADWKRETFEDMCR